MTQKKKQTLQSFVATLPHQREPKKALYQVCWKQISMTDSDRVVIGMKVDKKA